VIGGYAVSDNQRLGLEFERWINGPGPSYFRYHLLNDIDASGYDDLDTWTSIKAEVVYASKTYSGTVKDEVLATLNEIDGLELIYGGAIEHLLEPFNIKYANFVKSNAQYFVQPACEVVKIDGTLIRFRAFRNVNKWRNEKDTEKYRAQFKLAEKLLTKPKFGG
jgi:hypothetical protein